MSAVVSKLWKITLCTLALQYVYTIRMHELISNRIFEYYYLLRSFYI
jgi:hypothetical protein